MANISLILSDNMAVDAICIFPVAQQVVGLYGILSGCYKVFELNMENYSHIPRPLYEKIIKNDEKYENYQYLLLSGIRLVPYYGSILSLTRIFTRQLYEITNPQRF